MIRARSFATFLVLWAIAITALVLVALLGSTYRQAAAGREAVAKVRAYWAARAGVEAQIAALTFNTLSPDEGSAYTVTDDMAETSYGSLLMATFDVRHTEYPEEKDGPADAHAKINVNTMTKEDLILLSYMDEAMADSILDWIDGDDEPNAYGAEIGQYLSLKYPYLPRNAPVRSLAELELIAGVLPEYVRGEDWNLNDRLDANENDGNLSFPPDNADGKLDAGWSEHLTAVSDLPGLGASGEPLLDLAVAEVEDIQNRLGVDRTQAETIAEHGASDGATLASFISTDLSTMASQSGGGTLLNGQATISRVSELTREQLGTLLEECVIGAPVTGGRLGKLNINTCNEETLEYLNGIEPAIADAIILERNGRSAGFVWLTELLEVPAVTNERLAELAEILTVRSNVYVVSSRGRDEASGLEVEVVATIDRSSVPVVIRDLVVR